MFSINNRGFIAYFLVKDTNCNYGRPSVVVGRVFSLYKYSSKSSRFGRRPGSGGYLEAVIRKRFGDRRLVVSTDYSWRCMSSLISVTSSCSNDLQTVTLYVQTGSDLRQKYSIWLTVGRWLAAGDSSSVCPAMVHEDSDQPRTVKTSLQVSSSLMATTPSFDVLLGAFMSPDNAVRRQAEVMWEDMKQRAPDEVLEKMCVVMARREPENEGLRAMAAVLFRSLFGLRSDLWFRVQPQTKLGVKAALLACLTEEPVAHIRRKVTHAVGQLAGVSRPEDEWPELMALTVALCSPEQGSTELRVVGLDLVNILSEFCQEMLAPHESGLLQTFDACLLDPNIHVKVAALKATCSFLQELATDAPAHACEGLVLNMLSVLEASVEIGEEDGARDALEALNVVATKQQQLLVSFRCLPAVAKSMLTLAARSHLEISMRELSLELITSLCENAPDAIQQRGAFMVQEVVPLAIRMLAHKADDNDVDGELETWLSMATSTSTVSTTGHAGDDGNGDGDEDELGVVAAGVLSRVAIALGGNMVLSSALPLCSEFLADSRDWRRRKAGFLTLLVIGEGCGEDMANGGLLPQIVLGPILSGIKDPHPRVRYAALACVGQMAEDFREWDGNGAGGDDADDEDDASGEGAGSFQGAFHSQLLPALVQSLGGLNASMPRLQAAAAGALITFCNPTVMDAEWLYAPCPPGMPIGVSERRAIGAALLEELCELVRCSPSVVVKEECLTAVGCVAQVLGRGFGSFYGTLMPLAKEILSTTSPHPGADDLSKDFNGSSVSKKSQNTDLLRGKAMEAIALMGQAVGIEVFRNDAHLVTRALLAEQASVSRDPGNPQSTYTLQSLARIAGVLQEEFLPYLNQAIEPLLAVLSTDAEVKVSSTPDSTVAKEELEAAGMTAVEMDLRGVGRQLFGVNTSLMQAKESACNTLYQYTEDLGDGLSLLAPRALAVVLPNLGPRNAVAVQVVSAAIIPRLVGMASRRVAVMMASGASEASAMVAEADRMLASSVQELCEVVSNISKDLGAALEAGGGDMEPACIAADSLSTLLSDHCNVKKPSPLTLSAEREMMAIRTLRDAAIASMRRSQIRCRKGGNGSGGRDGGRHPLSGLTGAVDSADREEQEAWEDDLMTSAVDGIGWVIKKRQESFVPIFESELKPLIVPLLIGDQSPPCEAGSQPLDGKTPSSHKLFGLCMGIDILEHCGESGRRSIFTALLPALVHACADEAASTRQACAYGLGVAGEFGGPEFDPHASSALQLLITLSQGADPEDEDSLSVVDNAVSAAVRLVISRASTLATSLGVGGTGGGKVPLPRANLVSAPAFVSLMSSLLARLPLTTDVAEGHDCHRRIVALTKALDPIVLGGEKGLLVNQLVGVIAGMMVYQASPQEQGEMDCCSTGACPAKESEEQMWSRQLVDRETRENAGQALGLLRDRFKLSFDTAYAALEDRTRSMVQLPSSRFPPCRANS